MASNNLNFTYHTAADRANHKHQDLIYLPTPSHNTQPTAVLAYHIRSTLLLSSLCQLSLGSKAPEQHSGQDSSDKHSSQQIWQLQRHAASGVHLRFRWPHT